MLPKYRGAAPINWCIINGEKETGNTTMLMDVGLDTGDMLLTQKIELNDTITSGELHDILADKGASLLVETLTSLENDTILPIKQPEGIDSYASMLSKELGIINWKAKAYEIHNLIRGLNPRPLAFTYYEGVPFKIYESSVIDRNYKDAPGTIVDVTKEGILVSTGEKALLIKKLQFPNSKPMMVRDYLNGNEINTNIILGKEN